MGLSKETLDCSDLSFIGMFTPCTMVIEPFAASCSNVGVYREGPGDSAAVNWAYLTLMEL